MRYLPILLLLSLFSCKNASEEKQESPAEKTPAYPTTGQVIRLSPKLDEIIDTSARIEVIAEGYEWAEGPLWLESRQMLIWSDVPKNTVYSWKEGEGASVYLQPSGYTSDVERAGETGSNGLLLSPDGKLVLCQHGDRRMALMDAPLDVPKPVFTTIAAQYEGKRFNSPNDAAYDADGYLYFTDPPYGLEKQMDDPAKEIPFQGVYRVSPEGEVALLTDELSRPNGIAFSPDYSRCYVANSDPDRALWMVYELDEHKNFINGRIFFDATSMAGSAPGLPDGMKASRKGIVFATGPGGVWAFTPEGEHLGTISTGQATANCALNADESYLYMTADMYVLRIALK
ncbi:MAG: SMP-30/gluconolactonase/LRE family protein [Phaeodactylibacter sp.]|nr:SMP-30/gluconolactonase/LRE family protein [Phaeodactylibacter sp.]MCB9272470.1 SMP-30/gluconolactonase/LRE family protein [Lewinellaceae bacterium]